MRKSNKNTLVLGLGVLFAGQFFGQSVMAASSVDIILSGTMVPVTCDVTSSSAGLDLGDLAYPTSDVASDGSVAHPAGPATAIPVTVTCANDGRFGVSFTSTLPETSGLTSGFDIGTPGLEIYYGIDSVQSSGVDVPFVNSVEGGFYSAGRALGGVAHVTSGLVGLLFDNDGTTYNLGKDFTFNLSALVQTVPGAVYDSSTGNVSDTLTVQVIYR